MEHMLKISKITDTFMNNYRLFYSTDMFINYIGAHTVSVQTNEHCVNNIVNICLNIL